METTIRYTSRDARNLALLMAGGGLVLVLAYGALRAVLGDSVSKIDLFNLDSDTSLAAWFSSMQLLLVGVAFWLAARQSPAGYPLKWPFRLASLVFVLVSADEGIAIHERLTFQAKNLPGAQRFLFGDGHGAWIWLYLAAGLVLAAVGLRYVWFLWRYHRMELFFMLLGAGATGLGAVGLELIGYSIPAGDSIYFVEVIFEELLEMWGGSLLLYAALRLEIVAAPGLSASAFTPSPSAGAGQ